MVFYLFFLITSRKSPVAKTANDATKNNFAVEKSDSDIPKINATIDIKSKMIEMLLYLFIFLLLKTTYRIVYLELP